MVSIEIWCAHQMSARVHKNSWLHPGEHDAWLHILHWKAGYLGSCSCWIVGRKRYWCRWGSWLDLQTVSQDLGWSWSTGVADMVHLSHLGWTHHWESLPLHMLCDLQKMWLKGNWNYALNFVPVSMEVLCSLLTGAYWLLDHMVSCDTMSLILTKEVAS